MSLDRTTSSQADRPRTAFFLVLVSVGGGVREVHLGWKYADNSVGFYSDIGNRSKNRAPWGNIIDCKFTNKKNEKGEFGDYVVFENRRRKTKGFKLDEFNSKIWGENPFTDKVVEMRSDGRNELLALYLSLLPKSQTFSQNQEGVHDGDGFRQDGTGVQLAELAEKEGSLLGFREFVEKACQC